MTLTELARLDGADGERTTAVQAVHALTEAGVDVHTIAAHWRKVCGRPQGTVRTLIARLEGERPESHAHTLSGFGRAVKPL
jgi:hypothetical protein